MLTLNFKAPTQNTFLYVQQTNQIRDKMQKKVYHAVYSKYDSLIIPREQEDESGFFSI